VTNIRASELCWRFLAAMGLPVACQASAPPPVTVIAAGPTPAGSGPLEQVEGGATCRTDEVRDLKCGRLDNPVANGMPGHDGCSATGREMTAFGPASRMQSPDGLAFDAHFTDAWRDQIQSNGGSPLPIEKYCCYSKCTPLDVASRADEWAIPPTMQEGLECVAAPEGGTATPASSDAACPAAVRLPGTKDYAPFRAQPTSGVVNRVGAAFYDQKCCYATRVPKPPPFQHPRGRLLRDRDGGVVTAPEAHGDAWSAERGVAVGRPDRAKGEKWARDAALEHASVASFARVSLELLALGAPPELVAAAHRAALDEIEHARNAYALAAAHTGEARAPGPLAIPPLGAVTFASFARGTLRDACIGETAAALEADRDADLAVEPAERAALRAIAEDEARHAELAWRMLAWALRAGGGEARGALEAELAALRAGDDETVRAVVVPCLARLLDG
jgi:hypothetical protein